jgi:hypothetical protein
MIGYCPSALAAGGCVRAKAGMIVLASSNLVLVIEVIVPDNGRQNQRMRSLCHKNDLSLPKAQGGFMFA